MRPLLMTDCSININLEPVTVTLTLPTLAHVATWSGEMSHNVVLTHHMAKQ
jgi:hypothetical protein